MSKLVGRILAHEHLPGPTLVAVDRRALADDAPAIGLTICGSSYVLTARESRRLAALLIVASTY